MGHVGWGEDDIDMSTAGVSLEMPGFLLSNYSRPLMPHPPCLVPGL
jgi:hypothetical protein